jgi:hypothetical protein
MQLKGPATTPGIPASSITVVGPTQLKYCVTSYAPSRPVTVTEAGGTTASIQTDNVGAGCTLLPYQLACTSSTDRSAVATGVGADGNPATSSATVSATAGSASCAPTISASGHSLPGRGLSDNHLGLLLGVVGLVLGAVAVGIMLRRRRSTRSG